MINRTDLLRALQIHNTIARNKWTMPILGNVRLSTVPGCTILRIDSTDLENTIQTDVWMHDNQPIDTTVNLKALVKLLKAGKSERLSIVQTDNNLTVAGATVPTIPSSEFPTLPGIAMPAPEKDFQFITPALFAENLAAAMTHASTDETRFNLNGVLIDGSQFVATDGHRLLISYARTGGKICKASILPILGCKALCSALTSRFPNKTDMHQVWSEGSFFHYKSDQIRISIRFIDGQFPDYSQVMPKKANYRAIRINTAEWMEALASVMAVDSSKEPVAEITFIDTGHVEIKAQNPAGSFETVLNSLDWNGPAGTAVRLNARYLYEYLKLETKEKVGISFQTGNRLPKRDDDGKIIDPLAWLGYVGPVLLDGDYIAVIMSMGK